MTQHEPGDGTFITALREDQYGAFGQYSAADSDTSQSTLLLQKKKKMQEVQRELDRKKVEYEKRMRKCKEKELELAEKQEKIRESVVRFEKFVKENDAKRTRAMKKEKDEIIARKLKEQEIIELKMELEGQSRQKELSALKLEKLKVYEEYLESVVEASDDFAEITDLLARHATLKATNEDLRRMEEGGNLEMEDVRKTLEQYTKDSEDKTMVYTSQIGQYQKKLESLLAENAKLEHSMEYMGKMTNEKRRQMGEAKMSIANLYQRCRKSSHQKHLPAEGDVYQKLEYVLQRMIDLEHISGLQDEAREWLQSNAGRAAAAQGKKMGALGRPPPKEVEA